MVVGLLSSRLSRLGLVALFLCCGAANVQAVDDLNAFVAKFGVPDLIESSENERPRPPIVIKQMIYSKERVRIVFVPDAPVGSPPPYSGWKLLGFQDHTTNQVIKADEVLARMKSRKR